MVIEDIINKDVLRQDEIYFLIEEYIYQTKGVTVKVSINTHPLVIADEVRLMLQLMPYAIAYFKEKESDS